MSEQSIYDMAYRGKTKDIKNLLSENDRLKFAKDSNQRMLIHWAALGGHDDLVRYLLSIDVPVDPTDDMNMTPLILAASAGREKVINTLLAEGADVNAKTQTGHSSLQYAASKNWRTICVALLAKGANVNATDNRGATPLHRATSKGNIAIVKLLIEFYGQYLDIDKKDADGNSALHLACEENRVDEAKLLVQNGARVTLMNKEKKTPLDLANPGLALQLKKIHEN
ncbi:26S proteasome non-ATPase regulatory subunit 10 [Eufriesea mexicana]|uniref:26S proteasome non-ATPase regulatory subunit 10 n=1 Tax=Eufriesea mexicana TaxID=516756 RepID=A0A310S8V2_9HYME|nr:PREDICTED: 26S proteasome non-ATPase regulatory subunit 10-like [Eufriesea mexicana]OAD54910.1 26S proteasome non-ATPase regulatory subunit 10 [Eufriesea mexicana]